MAGSFFDTNVLIYLASEDAAKSGRAESLVAGAGMLRVEVLHELANAQAVSVNQCLATVIAERVGELKALTHVRARIARADPAKARAVLALVPDRTPMEGDELPAP